MCLIVAEIPAPIAIGPFGCSGILFLLKFPQFEMEPLEILFKGGNIASNLQWMSQNGRILRMNMRLCILTLNIRPPTRHRRICNVIFIYKMRRVTIKGYRVIDYEFDTDFECF